MEVKKYLKMENKDLLYFIYEVVANFGESLIDWIGEEDFEVCHP